MAPKRNAPSRVVVVTGGGGGIGAAVAEELGRRGAFVVTMDPLVTLDGAEELPEPEETTAGRIAAAGGAARASTVSVTDRDGVRALFADLVEEHGRLDAVVNVAGITRPTSYASGREEDWAGVLSVHLDGYLNVLGAALPLMATAGRGAILGVTSGSGWRAADAGAYSCAKRAVAALTWQLGRAAPAGVCVNAMSPIAVTRMVTAALGRARAASTASGSRPGSGSTSSTGSASGRSSTGGLSLGSMPQPEELGPFGAYLVGESASWCRGRVLFAGGPEVAVVDEPRLLEVVRTSGVASLRRVLDVVLPGALAAAESAQASTGGSNPRFAGLFDASGEGGSGGTEVAAADPVIRSCAVVSDRPELGAALAGALGARSVACQRVDAGVVGAGFDAAAGALAAADEREGPLDAVVVALAGRPGPSGPSGWERVLAEHDGIVEDIRADAAWTRAVADLAGRHERPVRLVTLTDATTAGGRSRAQAAAQLSRAASGATGGRVAHLAVAVEATATGPVADLTAHLACSPDAPALSGAEVVAGDGWVGLRSHPRVAGSVTFGGPGLPPWFDNVLRQMTAADRTERT
jgi:NAD(P)-dependent dehydrogenase (short-subunit alcohol dehydrogenase family)